MTLKVAEGEREVIARGWKRVGGWMGEGWWRGDVLYAGLERPGELQVWPSHQVQDRWMWVVPRARHGRGMFVAHALGQCNSSLFHV